MSKPDIIDIIRNANTDRGNFDVNSILSSVGFSLGISAILFVAFSLLRPRNTVVYAPKLKYADEKFAPPKLNNAPWAWIKPVLRVKEDYMLERIGLDAVIFLRFLRMCRNYLLFLTVLGCGVLIPVNLIGTNKLSSSNTNGTNPLLKLSTAGLYGSWLYAHIGMSYIFTLALLLLIWHNQKRVIQLRRKYFASDEFQASLHSRTLMLIDLPSQARSDAALAERASTLKQAKPYSQVQMGRDVGKIPALIESHEAAVRKLEGYLASYLKNPDKLPAKRPTHKGQDAIDYYSSRVRSLEKQIEVARDEYEAFRTKPYGFISYPAIPQAHAVAKANKGDSNVFLAPKPRDIIWKNMGTRQSTRTSNRIFGNVLFVFMCILWTVPNALVATFLQNIYNLGYVWPWFQGRINANPKLWAAVQGVLAPLILTLFFLLLPVLMRRLSQFSGSLTKTSRERNVFHKLYLFFFVNNFVIFTLFGVVWSFVVSSIVQTAQDQTGFAGFWRALKKSDFFAGASNAIINTSTFWILYVAQRNLGCFVDLVQIWILVLKWVKRTFFSPSPREMIEWSAPQPFDYASYYNSFLYNFTIVVTYAAIAPLILPFGLLYFVISGVTYKYTLLYVSITKVESGGSFWRVLVNRLLWILALANLVLFVVIWIKIRIYTAIAVAPIFVLLIAFKLFLWKKYDTVFEYCLEEASESQVPMVHKNDAKKDRLRQRFGHPALTQPLMVPMVYEKSRHLLRQVYKGRLTDDESGSLFADSQTFSGDGIAMTTPHKVGQSPFADSPGSTGTQTPGLSRAGSFEGRFELVREGDVADEKYVHQVAEANGNDEHLFADVSRPGTRQGSLAPSEHEDWSRPSTRGIERKPVFATTTPPRAPYPLMQQPSESAMYTLQDTYSTASLGEATAYHGALQHPAYVEDQDDYTNLLRQEDVGHQEDYERRAPSQRPPRPW
ncbi:hypothetical protein BCR37DRAFT_380043 [Protomyces lactucae-debilis]|uniref:DUF221-domain-containing protein n=1 Tax=Protomyces lactucae-debilis TaxID=2754530 RepID=A0A1Y2FES1_PROLT|nr:uncharacterized protein BCR37DRAFT_380043 [Protomyces lactucae-debilis]ORY82107.1 hypothetical protein BCR37DRAFT_380043 [Protomyces lactucae-debilis]